MFSASKLMPNNLRFSSFHFWLKVHQTERELRHYDCNLHFVRFKICIPSSQWGAFSAKVCPRTQCCVVHERGTNCDALSEIIEGDTCSSVTEYKTAARPTNPTNLRKSCGKFDKSSHGRKQHWVPMSIKVSWSRLLLVSIVISMAQSFCPFLILSKSTLNDPATPLHVQNYSIV